MRVARAAAVDNPEGSELNTAGIRLFTRINAVAELTSSLRVFPDPHDPEGQWYSLEEAAQLGLPGTAELQADLAALLDAVADDDVARARPLADGIAERITTLPNYGDRTRRE